MKSEARGRWLRFALVAAIPLAGMLFVIIFMDVDPGSNSLSSGDLYLQHCGNCHGKEGEGLRGLYPPLAGSDYLRAHQSNLPCLIVHGMSGPITVNGRSYDQPMPGVHQLNAGEVTAIINYINASWGNREREVERGWVEERLKYCAGD